MVELGYESGELDRAERDCHELVKLGKRLREGSDHAFSRGLSALIRYARSDLSALSELEAALAELRVRDASHRRATLQLHAGELDLARGDAARARERALEAESLARELERKNDVLVARVLAIRATLTLGAPRADTALALEELGSIPMQGLSARARHALSRLPTEPFGAPRQEPEAQP
jgi:ATP/maltotriose-dependent transcriptional regulator MalT